MNPLPFPHAVLRDQWDERELRTIAAEFPDYDDSRWQHYNMPQEYGKKAGDSSMWQAQTRMFFDYLRSDAYVDQLEQLTGIKGLEADVLGGGMHCTGEDGRLAMHVDFSVHPQRPTMTRRINLLVFLNEEWRRDWGGVLYLGANREVEILPLLGTTVVFETSSKSWHGHPDPIIGKHLRKSLAMYLYAPRRPDDDLLQTTVWHQQSGL